MAVDKWRFAVGTTSRVPHRVGMHYLILDYDAPWKFKDVFTFVENGLRDDEGKWIAQPTTNGWHVYTSVIGDFSYIKQKAWRMAADLSWLRIAEKRGYLFLADKAPVPLPWPVERMVIAREKLHRDSTTRINARDQCGEK